MQRKMVVYLFVFLFSMGIFAGLFPYPIFSSYTNVTGKNIYDINNTFETELLVQKNAEPKILSVDWKIMDSLMEIGKEYKLVDLESGIEILVQRTGGIGHAEIETVDKNNTLLLKEIFGELSWERRPVFLLLNDNTFVCASLSGYPHGENILKNDLGGHLCLHFKNSKMHGTNLVDPSHQKAIKKAEKGRLPQE